MRWSAVRIGNRQCILAMPDQHDCCVVATQVPTGGPALTLDQLSEFSPDLQSLVCHLCPAAHSNILQNPVLERAAAAVQQTEWGFDQAKRNPDGVVHANKQIRITDQQRHAKL